MDPFTPTKRIPSPRDLKKLRTRACIVPLCCVIDSHGRLPIAQNFENDIDVADPKSCRPVSSRDRHGTAECILDLLGSQSKDLQRKEGAYLAAIDIPGG